MWRPIGGDAKSGSLQAQTDLTVASKTHELGTQGQGELSQKFRLRVVNLASDELDAGRKFEKECELLKELDAHAKLVAERQVEKECSSEIKIDVQMGVVNSEEMEELKREAQRYRGVLWDVQVRAEEGNRSLRSFRPRLACSKSPRTSQGQKNQIKLIEFDPKCYGNPTVWNAIETLYWGRAVIRKFFPQPAPVPEVDVEEFRRSWKNATSIARSSTRNLRPWVEMFPISD